jgi:hypothetical protein
LKNSAANIIIANLPEMKRVLLEALDMVFIPKQVGRQFVLAVALETSMVSVLLFGYVLCCGKVLYAKL